MNARIPLTPVLEQQILASIRAGGYPHVAAAAWGVSAAVWQEWRRWSAGKRPKKTYKEFFARVEQAHAQARLKAEMQALADDPRSWLKHGPGREQPANPGWTSLARPIIALPDEPAFDVLAAPFVLELLATLRATLAPYPEALDAVLAGYERHVASQNLQGL